MSVAVYARSAFVLCLGLSSSGFAKDYILKTRTSPAYFSHKAFFKGHSMLRIKDTHIDGHLLLVKSNQTHPDKDAAFIAQLAQDPEVEYVVENIQFHAFDMQASSTQAPSTPVSSQLNSPDPEYNKQWALTKVRAPEAWDLSQGSKRIVVAVIDTGTDWQHEDLKNQIWINPSEIPHNGIDDDHNGFIDDIHGWDFRDNDNNPMDDTSQKNPGHGTHCSGIIGAAGNNGIGISGLSQEVSIMPIRFLGADGSGDLFASAKAIDYAVAQKAHIISASWGASVARSQIKPILEAIERAEKAGVVFVAAAANDGQSNDTTEVYPANAGLPNVISVAASNPQDQKPSWSNFGKHTVDLASPGEGILSTLPGNQYKNLSGTSMATPLVAGLVALMMAKAHEIHKPYSPAQIKAILQASGTTSDIETACQCRIDAYEALRHLTEQRLTLVPNTLSLQVHEQRSLNGMGGTAPYSFTSQDPEIIQVSPDGTLKAQALGETTVTVTDATGASVQSHTLFVHSGFSDGGDACPLQNPMMCAIICKIIPHMPWCKAPSLQGTSTYP